MIVRAEPVKQDLIVIAKSDDDRLRRLAVFKGSRGAGLLLHTFRLRELLKTQNSGSLRPRKFKYKTHWVGSGLLKLAQGYPSSFQGK